MVRADQNSNFLLYILTNRSVGATRLARLHHIGQTSTFLAVDAYQLAISSAKQGKNVGLYRELVGDYSRIRPHDPLAALDIEWAEKKQRELKDEGEKLEHELRSYKNNLIKESIRVCGTVARANNRETTDKLTDG
jgi:COP9 signalosome complex subunit 1